MHLSLPANDVSKLRGESVCGECAGEEFAGGGEYPVFGAVVWKSGGWAGEFPVGVSDERVCGGVVGVVVFRGEVEGEVEVFGQVRRRGRSGDDEDNDGGWNGGN